MTAQVKNRTACNRAGGFVANAAEARPVVKVNDGEIVALDDRVATPDFETERGCRVGGRVIEGELLRIGEFGPLLGNRREVLAAADAVEFDDLADHLLLHVSELHAAARKSQEGRREVL